MRRCELTPLISFPRVVAHRAALLIAFAVCVFSFAGVRAWAQSGYQTVQPSTEQEQQKQDQSGEETTSPDEMEEDQSDQQLTPELLDRFPNLVECRNGRTPDGKCKPPELPDGLRRTTPQQRAGQRGRERLRLGEKPEPPNDFQKFVQSTLGLPKPPPLFGRNLFENVPSTFAPADQIPVTADYAVGPGDQLLIRAWGQVNIDYSVTVDRNGSIYVPDVGTVNVSGIKYAQLNDYLRSAISRVFHNFDLAVTLGQLRSIQVLVVGQARRPGNYTISALSTVVNALFASGGPGGNGSMRHIQLKRGGRLVTEVDLYDLLLKGDKSKDVPLQNGDVIFVPAIGKLVAISGSVNVPAVYEVTDSTTLGDALHLAGGLATTAEGKQVTVQRIVDKNARQVEQFPLDNEGLTRPVRDGDIVSVLALLPKFDNAVTLRGNVSRPGRYPWKEGMRVRDLIPSRESLVLPAFWEARNSTALPAAKVGQKTLRTEVKRDAPDINWDYAVIGRLNLNDLTTALIPFDLGKAVDDASSPDNQLLLPNDVVTIFSQADFPVPLAKHTIFVRLEGEFVHGGVYQVQPGAKVSDIVARAGGLTPQAYLFGTEFTRESVRESQTQRLQELIDRLESDLESAAISQLARPGSADSAQLLQIRIQNQRQAIQRLKQVQATGRIALDLRPSDTQASALPDLVLEDGDVLSIPPRPSTVSVLGAVYLQGDLLHRPNATVGDYLAEAGGPTRDADRGRIYVIRANGVIRSRQGHPEWAAGSFGRLRLMPGDAIIVPQDFNRVPLVTAFKDWSQIFGQLAVGAASLKVILGF